MFFRTFALLALVPAVLCGRSATDTTNVIFRVRGSQLTDVSGFLSAATLAAGLPSTSANLANPYLNTSGVVADTTDRDPEDSSAADNDKWAVPTTIFGHDSDTANPTAVSSADAVANLKSALSSPTTALRATYAVDVFASDILSVPSSCAQRLCRDDAVCVETECAFGAAYDDSSSLDDDEKAGIAVGAIAFVLIVAVALCSVRIAKRRKMAKEEEARVEAGLAEGAARERERQEAQAGQQHGGAQGHAAKAVAAEGKRASRKGDESSSAGSSSSYFGDSSESSGDGSSDASSSGSYSS